MAFLSRTSVSFGKHAIERKWHLTGAEIASAAAVWRGIADFNFPLSLILVGIAGIVAIELRG